ncbi:MAG: M15 family metallopeptidase [Chloroflexi bacterium]|nr:M15 family metallopeptidase [Chloroflexota bacterium]
MTPRPLHPAIARARRLGTAVLIAVCTATGLLGTSLAGPAPAMAIGPLPACRYDDILTQPRAYSQWARTLVDTILSVPKDYVPPDLTSVGQAGLAGSFQVRAVMIPDLTNLAAAAKAAGNPIGVQSAYRSYVSQQAVFAYWVSISGYRLARLYSARPGHSEHQLGLAIDFKTADGGTPWTGTDWGDSPAGSWLRAHAWQYGFIQSYPKGKQSVTCYSYESWHFRYVGRAEAALIHASGVTLREYLWAHFTTAEVPPPTAATPSPGPSAAPSASPSEPPTEAPTLEPSPAEPTPTATGADPTEPPASAPPSAPAGVWLGLDATSAALVAALAVAIVMLVLSVTLSRRSRRAR